MLREPVVGDHLRLVRQDRQLTALLIYRGRGQRTLERLLWIFTGRSFAGPALAAPRG